MKKLIFGILAVAIAAGVFFGIKSCKDDPETFSNYVESVVDSNTVYMQHIVDSLNKLELADSSGVSFELMHYETEVELVGEVDTLVVFTPRIITNIYQITGTDTINSCSTTSVYILTNDSTGLINVDLHEGAFWVGDCNMMGYKKGICFEKSFYLIKKSNCVKPKSKFITLRQNLGPQIDDPQYIYGNESRGLIFVNATTGSIRVENPLYIHNITPLQDKDSLALRY